MSTRYFLASGAYIVVTFILGFVWHLVLFKATYQRLGIFSRIDDPIIPLGLTAMIFQGLILAYLDLVWIERANERLWLISPERPLEFAELFRPEPKLRILGVIK